MASLNKVQLIGYLGADPEVRYMPDGEPVAGIRLATTTRWKDKDSGEPRERTEWHRIVLYRGLARIAGEFLKLGAQVFVEGELRTRKWEAEDGEDRYMVEIIANELQMLDRKNADTGARSAAVATSD